MRHPPNLLPWCGTPRPTSTVTASNAEAAPAEIMLNRPDGAASTKRRPSASAQPAGGSSRKRARLARDGLVPPASSARAPAGDEAHHLPAEIWHRVFALLPPPSLGRLLRVNKLFHAYLDPCSPMAAEAPAAPPACCAVRPLKPDAIWQASRRLFWPQMPAPLQGKSELDMWRLCCARACQSCGRRDRADASKTQPPWLRGPGADAVGPVFPFSLVSCGRCLVEGAVKVCMDNLHALG